MGRWFIAAAVFFLGVCASGCKQHSDDSRGLATLEFAATVPGGFSDSIIATDINVAASMDFAPDGRLFVIEQAGKVHIVKNGTHLPTPFLMMPNVNNNGE